MQANIPLALPEIGSAEIDAVVEVLRSARLSRGPKLAEFEQRIAGYCQSSEAVGISSGTTALQICLDAYDIGPGDEVIAASFSFIAPANAIVHSGAIPVFVDVEPATLNIDCSTLETAITERTRAIVVVHTFGRPAAMEPLLALARRHDLIVIEDACEAFGAQYGGRPVGSLGHAGIFAFYPNKLITTSEGGVIVSKDHDFLQRCRNLRNQGSPDSIGYSARLSELHAALGNAQLDRLEALIERRERLAGYYRDKLSGLRDIELPEPCSQNDRISWFTFPLCLIRAYNGDDRDRLVAELNASGIGCARYFPAVHRHPYYRKRFGYRDGQFPVSESAAERAIALPLYHSLTETQIDTVCGTLSRELSRNQ